jgi:hypothetical protein
MPEICTTTASVGLVVCCGVFQANAQTDHRSVMFAEGSTRWAVTPNGLSDSSAWPVKRLVLALLIDRQDDGMLRRINVKSDDNEQFGRKPRIVGQLEQADPVRRQTRERIPQA